MPKPRQMELLWTTLCVRWPCLSSDPSAEITLEDGRTFTGLYQFGDARLSDYRKATGASSLPRV